MRRLLLGLVLLLSALSVSDVSYASTADGTYFSSGNTNTTPSQSAYGLVVRPIDGFLKSGEDPDGNVQLSESRYPRTNVTSDSLVRTGAAYIESVTFAPNDSAPTAGTIVVYDNTAESGTELIRFEVTTTYFLPFTIPIHSLSSTGIYAGFTTTADVNIWINWSPR